MDSILDPQLSPTGRALNLAEGPQPTLSLSGLKKQPGPGSVKPLRKPVVKSRTHPFLFRGMRSHFDNMNLTGTLPAGLSALNSMIHLVVQNNHLSGNHF